MPGNGQNRPTADVQGTRVREGVRRLSYDLDEDTFYQIKRIAIKEGWTFQGAIRNLVEWGLEAYKDVNK